MINIKNKYFLIFMMFFLNINYVYSNDLNYNLNEKVNHKLNKKYNKFFNFLKNCSTLVNISEFCYSFYIYKKVYSKAFYEYENQKERISKLDNIYKFPKIFKHEWINKRIWAWSQCYKYLLYPTIIFSLINYSLLVPEKIYNLKKIK